MRRAPLVLFALLLLVAMTVWWIGRDPVPGPDSWAGNGNLASVTAPQVVTGPTSEAAQGVERESASSSTATGVAPDDAGTGSLQILVLWSDGTPAPAVAVHLLRTIVEWHRMPIGSYRTDADGRVAITAVAPGHLHAQCDRGPRKDVEVKPGERSEVTLRIAAGVGVVGRVENESGAPVADAAIWLSTQRTDWLGGAEVARSSADGSFALRDVERKQSIGALAAGKAPSELIDLEQLPGEQNPVRVVLRVVASGGALVGRVLDPEGHGLPRALVAVGKLRSHPDMRNDGSIQETWSPRVAVTDDDGRYRFDALAFGRLPVAAVAPGQAFWHGECEIQPRVTTTLDIALPAPVTVHGVVSDGRATPMPGAIVRAYPVAIREDFLQFGQYDYDSAFGHPLAVADAAGRYHVTGIAPGKVWLYAGPGGRERDGAPEPRAATQLEGAPGAELEWSPQVREGHVLEGVVLHKDRSPMPDLFVSASDVHGGRQVVTTDGQGRFKFICLKPQAYDLAVQFWETPPGTPPLGKRDVWPDREPIELVAAFDRPQPLPMGSVRGIVQDAGQRLENGKLAVILSSGRSWRTDARIDGMAFSFAAAEPGRKQVVVLCGDDAVAYSPWFELAAGERKDLGTIVTAPGGALRLRIERPAGTEDVSLTAFVGGPERSHGGRLDVGRASEMLASNLSGGPATITAYGEGIARASVACEVLPGAEVVATLRLRAAVKCEIALDYPAERVPQRLQVRGGDGESFADIDLTRFAVERPFRMPMNLPIGRFVAVALTSTGPIEVPFEVESLTVPPPEVRVVVP